ncbi:MAG TPA: glycoside hydrolase family 3 N-terminal domain-containing protein [Solirubrobacterales bacterium]|nr:glycoside hydrolase family 3 N-terminal domain-containing protein [Solirubrobacterales bacterium]
MGVRRRRRRIAVGVAVGLAATAFAFGVRLGDGTGRPEPSVASRLPLGQLAGQRVVAGFQGTEVPAALRRMIRSGGLAGVILFAENLPSRSAGRRLVRRLQAIPRPPGLRDPLLVMVDQEGGLVKRTGGAPSASAEEMGARGAAFSRRQGHATAANLRGVGINVDLAPVLDVARLGGTISATHRGFGSTPARVAATGVAFAEGLQSGGVAATAKHFPGLGSARQNTDFAVERIGLSKATLRRVDEAPFRRFAEAGGEMVMLSTAIYPAFSPRPAAFARPIATGELRSRLGFQGVSITDAMEAVAVRDFGGAAKAGTAAARAGTDLLLFADFRAAARARRALQQGLRSATLSHDAFEASAGRVLRLRHGAIER